MIEMQLHTRPNRMWMATTTIKGVSYRAVAAEGASNKLAAILKRRGVPDQPLRVYNPRPGQEWSDYPSLYAWAERDYQKELAEIGQK